jgi:hypothetical protein
VLKRQWSASQQKLAHHFGQNQAAIAVHGIKDHNDGLAHTLRVHDGAETPSTISLKQASTIAEMRTALRDRPAGSAVFAVTAQAAFLVMVFLSEIVKRFSFRLSSCAPSAR